MIEVRIGISQAPKELAIEVGDNITRDEVLKIIEDAMEKSEGMIWLTDRKNTKIGIPVTKVAYVEVTSGTEERRVGFGAL